MKKRITHKVLRASLLTLGLLLGLFLVLLSTPLQAGGLGEEEIQAAVETWVRYVTADARPDAVVERMEAHQVDGETVAYIAHLQGGGFCLCGADTLVLPVYFYSPQGTYNPQNPDYQYILWEIDSRLKALRQALAAGDPQIQMYQEALAARAAFWQALIAARPPEGPSGPTILQTEPISMTLGLTSRWHQGAPYNDQCPLHGNAGQRTPVGCVATTMSQIMYYWQWPNTGVGTGNVNYESRWRNNWDNEPLAVDPIIDPGDWAGRLRWTAAGGGRLEMIGDWDDSVFWEAWGISNDPNYQNALGNLYGRLNRVVTNWPVNFGATTYQWGLMADDEWSLPPGGDAAVATLCHHAGVALGMNYGIWGSGTQTSNIEGALEDHFRYDHDATYGTRNKDTMTEEIQWLRPVAFRGEDADGAGHAWVVFGYNKGTNPNTQFKMNFGWGWDYSVSPYGWYSYDAIPHDLNFDQHHVTRIAPEDVVKFVGDDNAGDGSPGDPYEHIEEAITEAPGGATLIFKAGSVNTFSAGTLTINRPLTLRGYDVTIRKE